MKFFEQGGGVLFSSPVTSNGPSPSQVIAAFLQSVPFSTYLAGSTNLVLIRGMPAKSGSLFSTH
jgi:hypothetical protein